MCLTHGLQGTKLMVTKKVWSKLKNGMFGYKNSKVVKYKCKYMAEKRMVTTDGTTSIGRGEEDEPALRVGDDNFSGANERISRKGKTRAGANKGKSSEE